MRQLKDKLVQNIVAPVASSHSATFLDAVVLKANESSNVCDIQYRDDQGVVVTQKSVPVEITSNNIIGWFPKEKEHIIVSVKGGDLFITGPSYGKNYNMVRNRMELKKDIYSNSFSYFLGGFIF